MQQSDILGRWQGAACVLATMHGKERVITSVVNEALGLEVVVPQSFDTDTFGTFTRDVKRHGDQLQAARAKANAAMDLSGIDIALASEGSFGQHPQLPFLPSNLEVVVLVDRKQGIEVVGQARASHPRGEGQLVRSADEAVEVATSWGFPEQGVIVRHSKDSNRHIYKEIATATELRESSERLLAGWLRTSVYLETDMRAHRCPARMNNIRAATADLVANCKRTCPSCSAPGFVVKGVVRGLPCELCGIATDGVKEQIYACSVCTYEVAVPQADRETASAAECQRCNP